MYHPRLYGRYYDMGFKYGKLLYEKVNFGVPIISNEKMDFGLKSYQMLREYYPEVIEEIEGFACGIQDRPEVLGAFLLSLGFLIPRDSAVFLPVGTKRMLLLDATMICVMTLKSSPKVH